MGRKHELVSIAYVGRTYPTVGPAGGYLAVIDPRQVASALIAAEREREPIAPFSDTYPFLGVDGAYQAQQLFVEDYLNVGDQVIGASVGRAHA